MRVNLGIQTKLVAVLLITLFASSSFAQGTQNPTNEQIHRGNIKIGVGIGSVVAGLFLLTPAQTSAPRSEQNQNDVLAAGLVGPVSSSSRGARGSGSISPVRKRRWALPWVIGLGFSSSGDGDYAFAHLCDGRLVTAD